MAKIRVFCDVVPPQDIVMLTEHVASGSLPLLISHAIDFGYFIAPKLARGAKIASGNDIRGYVPISITLREKMKWATNIGINTTVEIPDVPSYRQLTQISQIMRQGRPDAAIARLLHWLWIASQHNWMYMPIFVMDHQRGEWYEYKFAPLLDARDQLEY